MCFVQHVWKLIIVIVSLPFGLQEDNAIFVAHYTTKRVSRNKTSIHAQPLKNYFNLKLAQFH